MNPTLSLYEPPLTPEADAVNYWKFGHKQLAPGVRGTAFERGGLIYIPLIVAEVEGRGDVGRFLDRLSSRCRIICVTSQRLFDMLVRRGWKYEADQEFVDIWRRQ